MRRICASLISFKMSSSNDQGSDWAIAAEIVETVEQRVVLAGGLNTENVREAIAQVNPFGVDISSGVEASHGIKDPDKMKAFIRAVKS